MKRPMRRGFEIGVALAVGLLGLLLAHHEMILTGMRQVQFDYGDGRFVNYLLEHGYRWMLRVPHHTELWNAPYFFPEKGVLAYAENMLGSMPIYAFFRLIGFEWDTSHQLWILSLGLANYGSTYVLFRRCFGLSGWPSAVGAALFAYAAVRINQTMHYQLFPHFFTVWAVHAVYRLFVPAEVPWRFTARWSLEQRRMAWIGVFALSSAGQLMAGVYLGWYLAFGLTVAGVIALALGRHRRPLLQLLRAHPWTIALSGVLAIGLLAPTLLQYHSVMKQHGQREFGEALTMVPQLRSWIHFGVHSWWYGSWAKLPLFQGIPMEHEQRCGFGLLTTALCLVGMWLGRKRTGAVLMFGSLIAIFLISSNYIAFAPWKWVYQYYPAAGAIRSVSRICIPMLIPIGLAVGATLQSLIDLGSWGKWAAVALGVLTVVEQGETTPTYDKIQIREDEQIMARAIDREKCVAFLGNVLQGREPYYKYQIDAMFAGMRAGVPTINGYSGIYPHGWSFTPNVHGENEARYNAGALGAWMRLKGLDPQKVCWVQVGLNEGPMRSRFVSQNVPQSMVAGQRYPVELVFENSGPAAWTPATGERLGSQAPMDNRFWGGSRAELPGPVAPGEQARFRFEVQAPAEPGRYPFQWRVLREHVQWAGEVSPVVVVEVTGPTVGSAPAP
jgi:hypothetical protein